ncbi:LacI family DNA-binding transcriptional regulator [Herbiconiux moechotypicola]|uniref:LacI family DNA-binding transcriptional regulator n=1 Tax=Herbiconiux moechotypicola TaxID=637393 RepID=A0ABP5Q8M1_9MICO
MDSAGERSRRDPTVFDVAALAGVSIASVSRHLSGQRVRSADAIDDAVARLGYRRNDAARTLRLGRSGVVALVVPNVASTFTVTIVQAAERAARAHDYTVALFSGESPHGGGPADDLVEKLRGRVDGAIVIPWSIDDPVVARLAAAGIAVVQLDGEVGESLDGPHAPAADAVVSDHHASGRLVAEHFAAAGHRRVGVVTGRLDTSQARERLAGFLDGARTAGLRVDDAHIARSTDRPDGGHASMHALLSTPSPPTAVFVSSAPMAGGAYRACLERGVRIPDQVSIAVVDRQAFDDLWTPAPTHIDRDLDELARVAADLLFRRLAGEKGPTERRELGVRLVPRASGAPPAHPQ